LVRDPYRKRKYLGMFKKGHSAKKAKETPYRVRLVGGDIPREKHQLGRGGVSKTEVWRKEGRI